MIVLYFSVNCRYYTHTGAYWWSFGGGGEHNKNIFKCKPNKGFMLFRSNKKHIKLILRQIVSWSTLTFTGASFPYCLSWWTLTSTVHTHHYIFFEWLGRSLSVTPLKRAAVSPELRNLQSYNWYRSKTFVPFYSTRLTV